MRKFTSKKTDPDAKRIDLFEADGKMFSIPEKVDGGIAVRFLENAATKGETVATAILFREVIGADALAALGRVSNLDDAEVQALMADVRTYVMGQKESSGN